MGVQARGGAAGMVIFLFNELTAGLMDIFWSDELPDAAELPDALFVLELVLTTALGVGGSRGPVGCGVAAGVCSVVKIGGDINLSGGGVDGCVPVDGCGIVGVPGGSGTDGCCSSVDGPGVGFMFCWTVSSSLDCSAILLNKDGGGTRVGQGWT